MSNNIKLKSGAIERIFSNDEREIKNIFKKAKKAVKLTEDEKDKILYLICKKLNLL